MFASDGLCTPTAVVFEGTGTDDDDARAAGADELGGDGAELQSIGSLLFELPYCPDESTLQPLFRIFR